MRTSLAKFGLWLVSLIPFWFLYVMSDFVAFILLRVVKYRKKIAIENIKRVFPKWDDKQIDNLLKKSYKNLSDIMLEGFKIPQMSEKEFKKRVQINNVDLFEKLYHNKENSILITSHLANWEWIASFANKIVPQKIYLVYKKLSSPFFEQWMKNTRQKYGAEVVEMNQVYRKLYNGKKEIYTVPMLSDQSPSSIQNAVIVDFFGSPTPFVKGPAFLSKRLKISLMYLTVTRIKRGYYKVDSRMLYKNTEKYTVKEIMGNYAQVLQQDILSRPEQWIWTHRRWKLVK